MKTPLQAAIDADVGPVWDREEAIARRSMIEALRWVLDGERDFNTIADKIAELEKTRNLDS